MFSLSSGRKHLKFVHVPQQQFSSMKLLFFYFIFFRSLILAAEWISMNLIVQLIVLFFSTLLVVMKISFSQQKLQHSFLSPLTLKNDRLLLDY